jgi:hypothetical protein
MNMRVHIAYGVGASVLVAATVVWGFVVVGSPETRRLQRLDEHRLRDLQAIHEEIQELVRDPEDPDVLRRPLPRTLAEAAELARRRKLAVNDPETGEPYGYALRGETSYQLSATFALERDADWEVFWNHPAGRHTFTIDALDPP